MSIPPFEYTIMGVLLNLVYKLSLTLGDLESGNFYDPYAKRYLTDREIDEVYEFLVRGESNCF